MSLVELESLGVRIGRVPILTDVDLRVEAGEAVGVFGPNGSGKTTLLSVLATFIRPSSGRGRVFGVPLGTRAVAEIRTRIGWASHDPGLYPDLTLEENLALFAEVAGADRRAVAGVLEMVGLAEVSDRRAAESSNGMRRRVDLARLLLTRPNLLLLDEAHAGLDTAAEPLIDHLVGDVTSRGGAAVLVSHHRESLDGRVARMARLEAGCLSG